MEQHLELELKPRYICGYKGSGKDTFCKWINGEKEYEYEIYTRLSNELTETILSTQGTRAAFADLIKKSIAESHGIDVQELEANKETYRQELIDLGQAMKEVDPLFWVKRTPILPDSIVTDFRFLVEVPEDGYTIRVFREDVPRPSIPSEVDLDEYQTDLVACPPGQFESLIKSFPQYTLYNRYM